MGQTIDLDAATTKLRQNLQNREEAFLNVLERDVYANRKSPYRRLLLHAGLVFEDVQTLVRDQGLEAALASLHDAGVYVTLDEFKGRAPVRRPGLEFPVGAKDFDNPLMTGYYSGQTGGSRSAGTQVDIDFDLVAHDAATLLCGFDATGVLDQPKVVIRAAPPSAHGLKMVFRLAHMDRIPERWFSTNRPSWNPRGSQARALILLTLLVSRLCRRRIPGRSTCVT